MISFGKTAVAAASLVLAAAISMPASAGNTLPSGKFYKVNIIGAPKAELTDFLGGNADTSNGKTLFIPFVTSKRPKNFNSGTMTCTPLTGGAQTEFVDQDGATGTTVEPDGKVRIYFDPTTDGTFEITDRDAVDGEGRISIPVDGNDEVIVDLYVRVLGGKGGCAEISGYAYDSGDPNDGPVIINGDETWWYSGSILVNRKTGKSEWVNATGIFETEICTPDATTPVNPDGTVNCQPGTDTSISVFDDLFDEYFWEVNNYKTRLIQMRFYLRPVS